MASSAHCGSSCGQASVQSRQPARPGAHHVVARGVHVLGPQHACVGQHAELDVLRAPPGQQRPARASASALWGVHGPAAQPCVTAPAGDACVARSRQTGLATSGLAWPGHGAACRAHPVLGWGSPTGKQFSASGRVTLGWTGPTTGSRLQSKGKPMLLMVRLGSSSCAAQVGSKLDGRMPWCSPDGLAPCGVCGAVLDACRPADQCGPATTCFVQQPVHPAAGCTTPPCPSHLPAHSRCRNRCLPAAAMGWQGPWARRRDAASSCMHSSAQHSI